MLHSNPPQAENLASEILSYMEMEGEHEKRARVSGTEKCRPGYGHFSSRLEEKGKEI